MAHTPTTNEAERGLRMVCLAALNRLMWYVSMMPLTSVEGTAWVNRAQKRLHIESGSMTSQITTAISQVRAKTM